jgi:hypothetical protein
MAKTVVVSSKSGKGLKRFTPVDTYLVQYEDGEGKTEDRLALVAENSVFILQERVAGTLIATAANKWFADDLLKALSGASDTDNSTSV